ncbi:hypothetical protein MVES_002815 [Malassezia vespertilionis]|uniref:C2H2-type domain-containing protein n=1 Tax=Malassezia vespertilionis TaxID=2020962 RepID=A0A2N1J8T3_9BASI|nr:hypothetical protein MVES_002815 [Malassezia vespertilionis]
MSSVTQGPIPIAKNGDSSHKDGNDSVMLTRTPGSAGSYLGLSTGMGGSGSFREAMAISFGKDVADTDSEATVAAPSSVRLESTFCRNFFCCGRGLDDLHDLLQHYEECHVRFEDEDEVGTLMSDEEMDESNMGSSETTENTGSAAGTPLHSPVRAKLQDLNKRPHPINTNFGNQTPLGSGSSDHLDSPSAFDTSVTRSPSVSEKKRAFGQANMPAKRERLNSNGTSAGMTPNASSTSTQAMSQSSADMSATEHRPYKCPAPGCDKAYKQMNGLKYHRLHGHCNQNLRNVNSGLIDPLTPDGSRSLQTSTPQLKKTMSTEKEASEPLQATAARPDTATRGTTTPDLRAFGIQTSGNVSNTASGTPSLESESPPTPTKSCVAAIQPEKSYVCQVGNCDKRYKNLNGLRYHYLHSGSHGLLGLQLLHANGGGASAKADSISGRPPVSTETLSREQIVQAAAAAQALLNQQAQAQCAKTSTMDAQSAVGGFASALCSPSVSLANTEKPAR